MKRIVLFVAAISIALLLIACTSISSSSHEEQARRNAEIDRQSELEDAYWEGYQDGEDASYFFVYEEGYEDGRSAGYDSGYEDGVAHSRIEWEDVAMDNWMDSDDLIAEIGMYIEDEATYYACDRNDWSPEDALAIIDDYFAETPQYFDTRPTDQEYKEAVYTLVSFYEYFYCGEYR